MRSGIFGFGIERLGLIALARPAWALALVVAISAVAAAGLPGLSFNSDIREVFRSSSQSSAVLDETTRAFGASDHDLLVVVEGDELFTPRGLAALRDFALDLRLADGVSNVLSLFSARSAPDRNGVSADLFPLDLAAIGDLEALRDRVATHPLVRGKLLSRDAKLALVLVTLGDGAADLDVVRGAIAEISAAAETSLTPAGLSSSVTGFPAIRSTVVGILTHDQLVFKAAAFALSILLSWLYFRSLRYLAIAVLPSAIAAVWLLGAMGWSGQQITVVTNVVPSLVMVITFSNAVHLLLAIRRERIAGQTHRAGVASAVRTVGPATVMTAVTTVLALSSLALVDRPSITSFGLTAAFGAALACFVALIVVPPLAFALLGEPDRDWESRKAAGAMSGLVATLTNGCARLVAARPLLLSATGISILAICGTLYFMNKPQFRFGANLPVSSEVARAAERIDEKLAGAGILELLVRLPANAPAVSVQTLRIVARASDVMAGETLVGEVWSLDTVARWYQGNGRTQADLLAEMGRTDSPFFARLIRPQERLALVSGYLPDLEASTLIALADRIDGKLDALRAAYPQARFELTGISLHSARAASEMIHLLSRSLLVAIVVIIVLIGVTLRSVMAGALTILPNLLPIAVAGAYLYVSGQQLQFTSIIIFTISFGIAVDSTIHVLNHYRAARERTGDWAQALETTVRIIGPALILATLALMAGGVTMLSPLPMAQLYGKLVVLVLATALAGDIVFLPALIATLERWRSTR